MVNNTITAKRRKLRDGTVVFTIVGISALVEHWLHFPSGIAIIFLFAYGILFVAPRQSPTIGLREIVQGFAELVIAFILTLFFIQAISLVNNLLGIRPPAYVLWMILTCMAVILGMLRFLLFSNAKYEKTWLRRILEITFWLFIIILAAGALTYFSIGTNIDNAYVLAAASIVVALILFMSSFLLHERNASDNA
jgi:hypothetical protein